MALYYDWKATLDPLKPGDFVLLTNERKRKGNTVTSDPFEC